MLLRTLRKSVKSLVWIIVIALVVSIVFTYGYGHLTQRKIQPLAKVNGVPISYRDFVQAYTNIQKSYQENVGEISPQTERYLKERVLNQLINNELIWQETKKAKIKATEKELKEKIKNIMINLGLPSREAFLRFLTSQHISYPVLEEEIKREIAITKLIEVIQNSIQITDKEIGDYWRKENEKVRVEYILISPEKYKKEIKIEAKEIENYYEEFKQDFTLPEKVKVEYILLKPEDFKDKIALTESMLKAYYEEHLDNYWVPEKRRVSHILVRLSSQADDEEEKEAKEKIEEAEKKLKEGKDFVSLAKEYSEDSSTKDKGGDLGFFTKEEMASSSFIKSIFSLEKVGDTCIVKTPLGYHLVKLTQIKPAHTRSFEEVKKKIEEELILERSWEFARKEGEEIRRKLTSHYITFEEYAQKHPDYVKTTPFFSRNERIENLGWVSQFNETAFSLKEGEISPLLKLPSGYCLLKLKERRPSYIPPLKEVKEEIEEKLTEEKSKTLAEKKAKEIRKKIKENTNLSSLAKEIGVEYKDLGYIRRSDWIEGMYQEDKEKFIKLAFSLQIKQISEPLLLTNGYYLIRLIDRNSFLEELSKQKETFTKEILSQKRAEVINAWVENLKQKAKIINNSQLFFSS